jgi:hypothetical protein
MKKANKNSAPMRLYVQDINPPTTLSSTGNAISTANSMNNKFNNNKLKIIINYYISIINPSEPMNNGEAA